MEILFDRWWMRALTRPTENGLLKNCGSEIVFVKELMEVFKVLKLIFLDRHNFYLTLNSKLTTNFISEKR